MALINNAYINNTVRSFTIVAEILAFSNTGRVGEILLFSKQSTILEKYFAGPYTVLF